MTTLRYGELGTPSCTRTFGFAKRNYGCLCITPALSDLVGQEKVRMAQFWFPHSRPVVSGAAVVLLGLFFAGAGLWLAVLVLAPSRVPCS
jgi:hypothetical protein